MAQIRAQRSVLSVPASSEKMITKAHALQVDQVLLDLEDGVAPEVKSAARGIISAQNRASFAAATVSIRVNSLESSWLDEDIALLTSRAGAWIDSIILPKVRDESDIAQISQILATVESAHGRATGEIAIDAQIESAIGLVNSEAIARAPRVASLNFGPADFMADVGATAEEVTSNEYALMRVLVAARAAGKSAIDGPTLEVRDLSKFERSAALSASMGFDGKWVLHPDQIESCHRIFTPSQDRFDDASSLLEAYQYFTSQAGGAKGAVVYKGAMIDEASRKMALTIFTRGAAAGMEPSRHFHP